MSHEGFVKKEETTHKEPKIGLSPFRTEQVCIFISMIKVFLFSLFTALIFSCTSSETNITQNDLVFPIIDSSHQLNWATIEINRDKTVIEKFIKGHPKDFEAYRDTSTEFKHADLGDLANDLHCVDLNNDGKIDIVFEGASGGEEIMTEIFINTGREYKEALTTTQRIVKMESKDKKVSRLYVDDWGCCADIQDTHKIFDASYDESGFPKFTQVYKSIYIENDDQPSFVFDKPFRFQTLNQFYNLRFAPLIDDTSFQQWDEYGKKGSGNSIGKLPKGTTGIAVGKKVDNFGKEWLYVELDEKYFPKNKILYKEDSFPTKVIGWISSKFIKKL